MDEVAATQEIDAVVVPHLRLAHTHIGGDHHIALTIMSTGNESIAGTAFDTGKLLGVEDGVATDDIFVVIAIPAERVGGILATVAHVTI